MTRTTKNICFIAMGVALYVVLALCLQVPVFENYYLCLGYVSMMVFCYYFGATGGITVGVLGVVLYCLLINGLRGLPGWAAGNLVIGLAVGLTCSFTKRMKNKTLKEIYLPKKLARDTSAREEFFRERERGNVLTEKYMLDLIREGWKNDDERLQRVVLG